MEVHAFLCNTVYQLIVAECYAIKVMDDPEVKCELYLDVDNTNTLAGYGQLIKKQNVFQKIYHVHRIISKTNKLTEYYLKIESYLSPRKIFKKSISPSELPKEDYYKKVFISYLGPMARWFVFSFPNAKVAFFEDGLGSYGNTIKYFYSTKKDRFFEFITRKGENTIKPVELLLFCPEFYTGEYKGITKKVIMPKNDEQKKSYLEDVFGLDDSNIYSKRRLIYLSQPIPYEDSKNADIESQLLNVLQDEYLNASIVRLHPRQNANKYGSLMVDSRGYSWEVACANSISESSVLIGFYSTAQFTPRLLYDKEPYLVFTYKMLKGVDSGIDIVYADEMVHRLIEIYGEGKIYVPETLDEYKKILSLVS